MMMADSAGAGSGRFDGCSAIVTGASRGIGFAIARALVGEGARVAITGRDPEVLQEAVESLGGAASALGIAGKADDVDHQDEVIARVSREFGQATLLVNNAGINPARGPMIQLDLGLAAKMLAVNSLAPLSWTQKLYDAGMKDSGGAVVNVSSVSGLRPAPTIGFYGTTKAALIHITASLALELGPRVRVNAVAPALVKTQFAAALYVDREERVAARYPMRRLGEPADIADAVLFLLSEQASWITGQTMILDGGSLLTRGA